MSDRRKAHEMRKKENFEQNLPVFFGKAASVNHVFAGTSFLMQFYRFYESIADGERALSKECLAIWQGICGTVRDNFLADFDGEKREEAVKTLSAYRAEITKKMQVLTTYTDCFSLYEYMLNRIEPRFEEGLILPEDDEAARAILRYIFLEKDNLLVNTRIQQMLSQLPVRMSRRKFEELVRAGFENYVGMDTEAADDFVYRIVSVAGLYEPEGMREYFPAFAQVLDALKNMDWKMPGEEDYKKAEALFLQTAKKVRALTDDYYCLMELVNLLYAWLLNYPYADLDATERTNVFVPLLEEICAKVLAEKMDLGKTGKYEEASSLPSENADNGSKKVEAEKAFRPVSEPAAALLEKTEGVLEEAAPRLQQMQAALSKMDEEAERNAAALMLEKEYACLKTSALLLSGSLFAALEPGKTVQTADRAYLKAAADSLVEKLLAAFSVQPTLQNRAMIAAVLGELPVFFNSQNEVMDYVRASLAGCHETAEKAAGIRLMRKLMEE